MFSISINTWRLLKIILIATMACCAFITFCNKPQNQVVLQGKVFPGLTKGTLVQLFGLPVGKVASMHANGTDPNKIDIFVKMNSRIKFRHGMFYQAFIQTMGGDRSFIELIPMRYDADFFLEIFPPAYLGPGFDSTGNVFLRKIVPNMFQVSDFRSIDSSSFFVLRTELNLDVDEVSDLFPIVDSDNAKSLAHGFEVDSLRDAMLRYFKIEITP